MTKHGQILVDFNQYNINISQLNCLDTEDLVAHFMQSCVYSIIKNFLKNLLEYWSEWFRILYKCFLSITWIMVCKYVNLVTISQKLEVCIFKFQLVKEHSSLFYYIYRIFIYIYVCFIIAFLSSAQKPLFLREAYQASLSDVMFWCGRGHLENKLKTHS